MATHSSILAWRIPWTSRITRNLKMTMSNISLHFFPPVSDSSKSPAGWVGPFSLQPARFSEHSACHCHSSKTSFFFFLAVWHAGS